MPQTVRLPNGETMSVPDGFNEAQIGAAVKSALSGGGQSQLPAMSPSGVGVLTVPPIDPGTGRTQMPGHTMTRQETNEYGQNIALKALPIIGAEVAAHFTGVGEITDVALAAKYGPTLGRLLGLGARAATYGAGAAAGSLAESGAQALLKSSHAPADLNEALTIAGHTGTDFIKFQPVGEAAGEALGSAADLARKGARYAIDKSFAGATKLAEGSVAGRAIRTGQQIDRDLATRTAELEAKSEMSLAELEKNRAEMTADQRRVASEADAARVKLYGQRKADAAKALQVEEHRLRMDAAKQGAIEAESIAAKDIAEKIGPLRSTGVARTDGERFVQARDAAVSDRASGMFDDVAAMAKSANVMVPAGDLAKTIKAVEDARPKADGTVLEAFLKFESRAAEMYRGALKTLEPGERFSTGARAPSAGADVPLEALVAARGNMSQELYALSHSKDPIEATQARKMIESIFGRPDRGKVGLVDGLIRENLHRAAGSDGVAAYDAARNFYAAQSRIEASATYNTLKANPGDLHLAISSDPKSVAIVKQVAKDAGREDIMPVIQRGLVEDNLSPNGKLDLAGFGDRMRDYGEAKDALFRTPEERARLNDLMSVSDRFKALTRKTTVQDLAKRDRLQEVLDRVTTKELDTQSQAVRDAQRAVEQINKEYLEAKAKDIARSDLAKSSLIDRAADRRAAIPSTEGSGMAAFMRRVGAPGTVGSVAGAALGHGVASTLTGAATGIAVHEGFSRLAPVILRIADDPVKMGALKLALDRMERGAINWESDFMRVIAKAATAKNVAKLGTYGYLTMRAH